jgi:hypothetical protein
MRLSRVSSIGLGAAAGLLLCAASAWAISPVCAPMNPTTANNLLAGPWSLQIVNVGSCRGGLGTKGQISFMTCVNSSGSSTSAITGNFTVAANCVVGGEINFPGTALTIKGTMERGANSNTASFAIGNLKITAGAARFSFFMIQTK